MRTLSFRRILLRAAPLLLVACGGHGRVSPPGPGNGLTLLQCTRTNPASAKALVDVSGDEITVRRHRFHLRPNSVTRVDTFTVTDRPDGYAGVDIEPHGTRFDAPAKLTLSYAHCGNQAAGFRSLEIVEVEPGGTVIVDSTLNSEWNPEEMTVTTEIKHLSGYLISGT